MFIIKEAVEHAMPLLQFKLLKEQMLKELEKLNNFQFKKLLIVLMIMLVKVDSEKKYSNGLKKMVVFANLKNIQINIKKSD